MNLYTGLLFQQGYIQDPQLALSLADQPDPSRPMAGEPQPNEPRRPARTERRASFRRGAVFAVCSTALSPFR